MTDLDRASLERVLPSTPGSADWEDVLRRAGAGRGARRRRLVALAAAVLVVVVGTASAFGTVRDLVLGAPVKSKIAFQSFRDGRFDAYVMNVDGSGQRRLTAKPEVVFPVWSPDGRKVAFANFDRPRWRGNVDLYVMNADGSGLRRLTRDSATDGFPVWSPDGRKIAFTKAQAPAEGRGLPEADVYVINADGTGERNLTGDGVSGGPTWSPDGRRIAFGSSDGIDVMSADGTGRQRLLRNRGHFPTWSPEGRKIFFLRPGGRGRGGPAAVYIYVVNADGSAPRRLIRMAQVNYSLPSWSPDGRTILFVRERDGKRDGNFEVYVMNADGSGKRNLTRHPGFDSAPAWSPDGRKIVFTTKRDGNFEVYVMNADGSGKRNLTRHPGFDSAPAWSPDGRKIVFTTKRDGNFEVYVMNADGSDQRNLTRNPAPDRAPVWSPGGKGG
jgi:Tol biopolymer transport system component